MIGYINSPSARVRPPSSGCSRICPARFRNRPPENSWIGLQIDKPSPDLVAFAKAQGFDGEQVSTTEDLAAALERGAKIVAKGGRYLIDAVIEPDDAVARRSHETRRA